MNKREKIKLLKVQDNKYYIKFGNNNFPIILDEKLYNNWIKKVRNLHLIA